MQTRQSCYYRRSFLRIEVDEMSNRIVTVFGGSRPVPGSEAYQESVEVGKALAAAGFTVMTGGYAGTMQGVSEGAKQVGGHVIGVASGLLERKLGRQGNPYVDEFIRYDTLTERQYHLVTQCSALVALRGGIGTLSEVAQAWSLIQVGEMPARPFVLLGQSWEDWLRDYYGDGSYIRENHMGLVKVVYTPAEVADAIVTWKGSSE